MVVIDLRRNESNQAVANNSIWRDCSVAKFEDEVLIARLRRAGVRELFVGLGATATFPTASGGVSNSYFIGEISFDAYCYGSE